MAEFIGPVVEWVIGVLRGADFGELEAFAEVRKSWTGVVVNWPSASVMGRGSVFDPEVQGLSHSVNTVTIKFGVNGTDPDALTELAWAYMKAIDNALTAADDAKPLPQIKHLHIGQHDYGPLFQKDGGFARFPEMHLDVEVWEGLGDGAAGAGDQESGIGDQG